MSQIYKLISDVTVTSFEMGSTQNLNIISARYSGKCVQIVSLFYLIALRRYRRICKGGNYMPPQRPADGAEAQRPPD